MEMIADAYDRSHNDQYKEQIVLLYQGFIVQYTTDWRSSPYNDDIMCVLEFVLACKSRLVCIVVSTHLRFVLKSDVCPFL